MLWFFQVHLKQLPFGLALEWKFRVSFEPSNSLGEAVELQQLLAFSGDREQTRWLFGLQLPLFPSEHLREQSSPGEAALVLMEDPSEGVVQLFAVEVDAGEGRKTQHECQHSPQVTDKLVELNGGFVVPHNFI